MKKLIYLLLLSLAACVSPQKALMRSWKIDDVVFLDTLNTLPVKQKEMLAYNLKNTVQFSFLPDSVYQVITKAETVNGKWWFTRDKKALVTTTPQGTIESKIYELKKNRFKFESAGELNQSFLFSCSPVLTGKK